MNSLSPTAQGFGVIFRRPAVPVAEIAWRWSFVAAAWVLGIMYFFEYMDSLPVTTVDRLLLITSQPVLIARAIHRIFQGSAIRFTEAGVLLGIGLTIAWIALASLGRAATVNSVMEEFGVPQPMEQRGIFSSLLGLNFLRAVVTLAALVGVVGAIVIANSFWASTHVSAADASRLFFLVLFFVWLVWVVLNWLLSTAAVFVVSKRSRVLTAIAEAVRLCQEKPGPVLSTGALFGIAHWAAFVAASAAGFTILGALGSVPPGLVWFAQMMLIFAYLAVADFLYTGRMAAYVLIIRGEEAHAVSESGELPPLTPADSRASIDPDELILSDVPLPAM